MTVLQDQTLTSIELARQFCDSVPHNRDLGIEVVSTEIECTTMRLKPHPGLLGDTAKNLLFNSVSLSLADACSGLAVFVATKTLVPISTLDLRMDYLRPASAALSLNATATCYRHTAEIAFVRCFVFSESVAEPVAIGSSVFMRAKPGGKGQAEWNAALLNSQPQGREARLPISPVQASDPASFSPALTLDAVDDGCDDLHRLIERLPYARHLKLCVAKVAGRHCIRMPFRNELIGNMILPALHGGTLGALMEITALTACQQLDALHRMPKLIDSTMDFLRSGRARDTFAMAKIIRSGQRVITVHVDCWQDDPSNVIAIMRMQLLVAGSIHQ